MANQENVEAPVLEEPEEEKEEEVKGPKKSTIAAMTEVLESQVKTIPGLTRKIHHLWDNHFRVNFWDLDTGKIDPTHFVTVNEDGTCTLE